jgi:hypothetical protein
MPRYFTLTNMKTIVKTTPNLSEEHTRILLLASCEISQVAPLDSAPARRGTLRPSKAAVLR